VAERAEPILNRLASSERRIEWSAAALGFAIMLQTGGIIWWGATMNQRMAAVEQKIGATASAGETIARLREQRGQSKRLDRFYRASHQAFTLRRRSVLLVSSPPRVVSQAP
jgi:hypothetical protein